MRRALAVTLCALAALALPAVAEAQARQLRGTVGPGFTITLVDESGNRFTHLDAGEYTIVVTDNSVEHNFHLTGPGVSVQTEIDFVGTMTWTLTLTNGIYRFVCDPHADAMNGEFAVGTASLPPPRPPATRPPAQRRLVATVGPGFTISVRTAAGARVTTLRRGTYTITVRDRSRAHNFHLLGPRINRRTTVAAMGSFTWRVTLRPGRYRFVCDPHAAAMRGSFRVR
jgi:plastocyanin